MDCRRQASLSITKSQSLLKLMSIELVIPSNHLILCRPLLLLPSIFPASESSNESASGGQSIEVSASTSALPMNTQDWSFQWMWNSSSVNWGLCLFPWCSGQKESYLVQLSQSVNTMKWHCFKSAAKSTCAMLVWQLGISDRMHSTWSVSPLTPVSAFRKSG